VNLAGKGGKKGLPFLDVLKNPFMAGTRHPRKESTKIELKSALRGQSSLFKKKTINRDFQGISSKEEAKNQGGGKRRY